MKSVKSGNKYSLKDHDGRTFNFFTTKQDGTDTSAFSQFKTMGLKVGDTVMIGYVEDEFEIEGKNVISKKIINFRETNELPSKTAPQAKSSTGEANSGQAGRSNDAFGRRLAVHGFINGLFASGMTITQVKERLTELVKLEDEIDGVLGAAQYGKDHPNIDLPIIHEEDLNVEDVPF